MGSALAERLLKVGSELVVHDIDAGRCEALVALGARATDSARAVADEAHIVLACLPSQNASRAAASAVSQGNALRVYVETSTIGQAAMRSIADELQHCGIGVLDMPVSGGPNWAREGKLVGILSGAIHARHYAADVLNCLAGRIIVVGDTPGQGQVAKVINNALSLTGMMIACEAIVTGVNAGVDATALIDVINAGTGRNSATIDKFPKAILPRTFKYGGPIGLGSKDLQLYLDLDQSQPPTIALGHAVSALWQSITDEIGEDADLSEMVRYFEKRAGVEVRGLPAELFDSWNNSAKSERT